MKKNHFTKLAVVAAICTISLFACKKKEDDKKTTPTPTPYTCSSCTVTPQAKAANDASSKGIYKGVIIGSTGTVIFDIANDGSLITAIISIDGVTATLTSAVTWVAGEPYIADFTGSFSGSPITVKFSVDAIGSAPYVISSSIPGHASASFAIDKEKSTGLLECFEGTYNTTKPEDGTFNLLISRKLGKFTGSSRALGSSSSNPVDGEIDASGNLKSDGTTMGALSGDKIDGTFTDNNGRTVTITGKRTL